MKSVKYVPIRIANLSQSEIEAQAVIQDQLAEHHLVQAAGALSCNDTAAIVDHTRAAQICFDRAAEYRARLK